MHEIFPYGRKRNKSCRVDNRIRSVLKLGTGLSHETHEMIAAGLLVLMAVIFCASLYFEHVMPWLRIVRAFSEASMIGALADWFAVVVLFRRPLGIPIPHTAIIPKSKDRIGSILGGFVVGNFLTEEVIKNHLLNKIDLAEAFSGQLIKNADIIAAETVLSLPKLLDLVKDDDVHSIVKANILRISVR